MTESMEVCLKRGRYCAAAALLALIALPGVAGAHGDIASTNPKKGAMVARSPSEVSVTLTEAPTKEAQLQVLDGCNEEVTANVLISGETITASVADAQPGRWSASFRAISAVDGHPSDGRWTFNVSGQRDCSADESPAVETNDEINQGNTRVATDGSDGGSSFPLVPVAIGAVAVIGGAFLLRRSTAR